MITQLEDFRMIFRAVIDGWSDVFYSAFEWCQLILGGHHRFFINLTSTRCDSWIEYYRW